MSDRGTFWPAPPDWATARTTVPGVTISAGQGGRGHWLLSGERSAIDARIATLGEVEAVLPIAPDRVMLVTQAGAGLEEGWHPSGLAISDLSQAFVTFDLRGPDTAAVLAMGSPSLALDARPRAAALGFAGLTVLFQPLPHGARLYVDQSQTTHLWQWFSAALMNGKVRP